MKARTVLWLLCGLFAAGALGLWLYRASDSQPSAPASPASATTVGGPFQLVDQNGVARDQSLLRGRWSAVFFGFTHCPDICPTTLQTLGAVNEQLGDDALRLVFVTVDPARDTPALLKTYLDSEALPRGVIGLTGSEAQVAAAARAYRIHYARQGEGDDYVMDHTSLVFLMDPQGRFHSPLRFDDGAEAAARRVRAAQATAARGTARPS